MNKKTTGTSITKRRILEMAKSDKTDKASKSKPDSKDEG